MVQQNITPESRLIKLSYKVLRQLAEILDIPGPRDWKALAAELEIYSRGQIAAFERQAIAPGGSPAFSVLQDLSQQLYTVDQLITYLKSIGNQEALLILKPHEPVVITQHPLSDTVPERQEYVLRCEATGFPLPRYEWLKNNVPISDARTQTLKFTKISILDNGEYMCKVSNPMGSVYSHPARIQVSPSNIHIVDGVTAAHDYVREIPLSTIKNAEELVPMLPGQEFILNCDTLDASYFQWQKNGYPMPGECQPKLIFRAFNMNNEGRYSCKVTNHNGLVITTNIIHLQTVNNQLGNQYDNSPPLINHYQHQHQHQLSNDVTSNHSSIDGTLGKGAGKVMSNSMSGTTSLVPQAGPTAFATGKFALVIANQNYISPRYPNEVLVHPHDDATLLENSLEEIGFKVIRLFDLTKREMETALEGFCKILKSAKGLYSLFYFCGHGFEEAGKTFLMPVDVDTQWTAESAISAEYVLSKIQHCRTTKLDVMLLDVCRVRLDNDTLGQSNTSSYEPPFIPGKQCVFGYATCPQSMAFEKRSDKNGLYMKHLAAHLRERIQIENLLHLVGAAVKKEADMHHLTRGMSPSIKSTTTEIFTLTDPIMPIDFECDPTNEWFNIHRLPAHKVLTLKDGIVIDIKFSPVSSNVCCIIIHVVNFGKAHWCDANIIELSNAEIQVPYNSMNQEHPVSSEFLSKCVSFNNQSAVQRSSEFEKLTQVSALQKLTGPIALTIQVKYYKENRDDVKTITEKHVFSHNEFGIAQFFNP
ncbi:mucosa-associated lymphoid tissue lymphoma translocation protein 1-like [Clytia hemisphaerica]|uniref:Mucosa-associated lymphoid tissue lymphoma translocation protein 1 n=1 Tax=Clytia hemisphaerica TaxID=252671 RepID=A0A7M5V1B8_9CNID|eukprot:TCONS_00022168-protein